MRIAGPNAARAHAIGTLWRGNTEGGGHRSAPAALKLEEGPMRYVSSALFIAAMCGCTNEIDVTQPAAQLARLAPGTQYQIVKLPSLGGGLSRGMAINSRHWVAGWSNRQDGTRRAALWQNGSITDLLTLGGPSSTVAWPGLNDEGTVVGISHTAATDPLNEDWSCEAGGFLPESTNLICRGFVWKKGVMRELPTLGGNHGFAAGLNNQGQVVGWAETSASDPTCLSPQVLRFRAVVWEPKKNTIKTRELSPFPGDSTSAATAINDRGQAVGISGDCDQAVGRFSARHAVLWSKNGKVTEIPNLGGVTWHTPMDINESGDVVGFSNPVGPGDPAGEFISHAFLWTHGGATARDLGTLPGDLFSEAFAINSRGQVVGVSFGGANGSHAFLWQDGVMTDLNGRVGPPNLDVFLSAQDINDDGQITGRVLDHSTGETVAFAATPMGCSP
jgi:probable HAF family extracellular repeat protein